MLRFSAGQLLCFQRSRERRDLHSFPTRRSSDLTVRSAANPIGEGLAGLAILPIKSEEFADDCRELLTFYRQDRSEEHTSELQSHSDLVCRLLLEKKKKE